MTLDAVTFTLTNSESGRPVGVAVICHEARYASVLNTGDSQSDRKFATPAEWEAIAAELAHDALPLGPLPRELALVQLLTKESGDVVQFLHRRPIACASPLQAALALDAALRDTR